jgi:hypothetical protein
VTRLLIRLYPRSWQARYADEFEALLDDQPLGPFDVADVLFSAIDAHLRLRSSPALDDHRRGVPMTLRTAGIAAILGGALWLVSLAGASATHPDDGQPWLTLFVLSLLALASAMIGLSAEQGRRLPGLMWAAVGAPLAGAAISAVGLIGMITVGDQPFVGGVSPWNIWVFGILLMLVGSGLFAFLSMRVRTMSRVGTGLLVVGAVTALPFLMGISYAEILGEWGHVFEFLGIFAFAAGWVWLGIGALRWERATRPGPGAVLP